MKKKATCRVVDRKEERNACFDCFVWLLKESHGIGMQRQLLSIHSPLLHPLFHMDFSDKMNISLWKNTSHFTIFLLIPCQFIAHHINALYLHVIVTYFLFSLLGFLSLRMNTTLTFLFFLLDLNSSVSFWQMGLLVLWNGGIGSLPLFPFFLFVLLLLLWDSTLGIVCFACQSLNKNPFFFK